MASKQAEQRRRERQSIQDAIAEANRTGDAAALKPGIEDSRRRLLGGRKKDPNIPSPGLRAMAELVDVDGYALNEVANEQAKENAATMFRAMGHDDHKSALALTFEGTAALLRGAWAITWLQGATWMRRRNTPLDEWEISDRLIEKVAWAIHLASAQCSPRAEWAELSETERRRLFTEASNAIEALQAETIRRRMGDADAS